MKGTQRFGSWDLWKFDTKRNPRHEGYTTLGASISSYPTDALQCSLTLSFMLQPHGQVTPTFHCARLPNSSAFWLVSAVFIPERIVGSGRYVTGLRCEPGGQPIQQRRRCIAARKATTETRPTRRDMYKLHQAAVLHVTLMQPTNWNVLHECACMMLANNKTYNALKQGYTAVFSNPLHLSILAARRLVRNPVSGKKTRQASGKSPSSTTKPLDPQFERACTRSCLSQDQVPWQRFNSFGSGRIQFQNPKDLIR